MTGDKSAIIPRELQEALEQRKCFFLVGAGISVDKPTNLPTTDALRTYIAEWVFERSDCIRAHWNGDLTAFEHWCSAIPLEFFLAPLPTAAQEAFLKFFNVHRPNFFHTFLAHALSNGIPVVAANVDTLIEQSCGNWLRTISGTDDFAREYLKMGGSSNHYLRVLFKLRGSLEERDSVTSSLHDLDTAQGGLPEPKKNMLGSLSRTER